MLGSEAAAVLRGHLEAADAATGRITALAQEIDAAIAEAKAELTAAAEQLATCYLPALVPEGLAHVRKLTGFTGFERLDPLRAMPKEAERLQRRIAQILSDETYVQRKLLVGPMGSRTLALAENEGFLAEWERACAKFETLDRWSELLETGYDTPSFSVSWVSPRYWKLWAAGDAACAALGLADFGDDVLPSFRAADAERQKWRDQVRFARAAVDAVHELVREHDESVGRLANLPRIFLDEARTALGAFLVGVDHPLLAAWAAADPTADPAIPLHLKRVAGLSAKLEHLETVKRDLLQPSLEALGEQSNKWRRKLPKLEGKRYGVVVGESASDPGATERLRKLEARTEALDRAVGRIRRYDDYDRFSLDNPPELWWREFTGGAPPSRLGLRSWYDRNPSVIVIHEGRDDASSIAAAAASSDLDSGLGHLS